MHHPTVALVCASMLSVSATYMLTSLIKVFNAKEMFEQLDHLQGLGWIFNALGGFYFDWKDYNQAKEYFKKALNIFKKLTNYLVSN